MTMSERRVLIQARRDNRKIKIVNHKDFKKVFTQLVNATELQQREALEALEDA